MIPRARVILCRIAAVLFVAAGALHFARPEWYERIVPPGLPFPRALIFISGAAEVAGGLGLLVPRLRRWAGYGLILLLACVFPANAYMALRHERFADLAPAWALWARLPLQGVLVAWVWAASQPKTDGAARRA